MPRNPAALRRKERLRKLLHPEFARDVFPESHSSPAAMLQWAKFNRLLKRTPGKGIRHHKLAAAAKFEFYRKYGSEKSWQQLSPAQRKRLAQEIMLGIHEFFSVHHPFDSVDSSLLGKDAHTFERTFRMTIFRMENIYENMLKAFRHYREEEGEVIRPDDIRRARNAISIFQHIFNGFMDGEYRLPRA